MSDLRYFDKIKRFLGGEMNKQEHQQFETELEKNDHLKSEYRAYMATEEAFNIMDFKAKMQVIKEREVATKNKSKKLFLYALAAGLFLTIGFSLWYANKYYQNRALYSEAYKPPNLTHSLSDVPSKNKVEQAERDFTNGNMEKVIAELSTIPSTDENYFIAQFILGSAYLQQFSSKEAILALIIAEQGENKFQQRAQWYLALAYLQSGDIDACRTQLQSLRKDEDHIFNEKAGKLLHKLDQFWRKLVF